MGGDPQPTGLSPKERLKKVKLDNLPVILNFDDEKTPVLVETRERVIRTVHEGSVAKAAAVASTYEKMAEDLLDTQLDESRRNAPPDSYQKELTKARAGLLINLARIWRDAGVPGKCVEAIDRAIRFAKKESMGIGCRRARIRKK